MKLEWIGHSCFRLTADDGTVALTDPYDARTGYEMLPLAADLVTMSHEHGDHNCEEMLTGKPVIAHGIEEARVGGIAARAIPSFHDDVGGAVRGRNAIRIFDIDGLKIVHMGDQGCMPPPETIEAISGADVMLIPCGGFYTVDAMGAKAIVDAAKPRLAVPMHVRLTKGGFDVLSGPQPFLALMGAKDAQPVDELRLEKGSVPSGVALLRPKAGKL